MTLNVKYSQITELSSWWWRRGRRRRRNESSTKIM